MIDWTVLDIVEFDVSHDFFYSREMDALFKEAHYVRR
jgi:hypothetical protein